MNYASIIVILGNEVLRKLSYCSDRRSMQKLIIRKMVRKMDKKSTIKKVHVMNEV